MAAKKKDTVTLPRGIRPHRSGYIVDVTVGGKRRTKTAATLEAALLAREALRNAASATSNSAGAGDDTSRDELVVEEGPSTIFGELEMEEDGSDALEDQDDTEQTEMDASKAEQDADTDEEEYDDGDEN